MFPGLRLIIRFVVLGLLFAANCIWANAERQRQIFFERYGQAITIERFDTWQQFMFVNRSVSELDKLRRTNDYLNHAIRYAEDGAIWGTSDYWATPLESLGRGMGDCEDYVIAKYFTLRQLGVDEEKLRFVYVKATITGVAGSTTVAHMVLAYFPLPDAMPLILDNLSKDVRSAGERPDLNPVFSFNMSGVFTTSGSRASYSVDRLSRWKDLILRMRAEGFDV